ncbi:MAG: VCBS repeat-containing protein [Deltaproteobacteria bacterium]|nr:VCBS repeat-containing protein [Deltaproteobacteria bacterium]
MEVSDKPGWRVFSVGKLDWHLLGYDELFVLFEQEGEARVGLAPPAPTFPGDYPAYGGIIGDIPGDLMECFPTMSAFSGPNDEPLVWLMRVEIEADEVVETHEFEDQGVETLNVGGHVSFGDYDNDGDEDFLSGGSLWRNDGTGAFTNVSEAAGLTGLGGETVWGDYDNDGHRDILGIGGKPFLYHSNGDGSFTNATEEAGIAIPANSQGVVWFDLDGDTRDSGQAALLSWSRRVRGRLRRGWRSGRLRRQLPPRPEPALEQPGRDEGLQGRGAEGRRRRHLRAGGLRPHHRPELRRPGR